MASDVETPKREGTPVSATLSSIPQKRVLEEDHAPAVSSPLNPNLEPKLHKTQSHDDIATMGREKPSRTKKESLKKRESKGISGGGESSRATPDPKQKEPPTIESGPLRYKLAPPKPSDFDVARGPVFVHHHDVAAPDGSAIEFCETSEHVYNKKSFHYTHCIADPAFPSSFYYRQTEPEPHNAHISFEDAAQHMFFDQSGHHITTDKGFRMARANVAVREGKFYWECKITRGVKTQKPGETGKPESHGHVRVGFARREASLDAPVGFDAYSYGIRDLESQKVHMSRPKEFFQEGHIGEGDVIGLEIQLPSEQVHRKVVAGHFNPAVDLLDDDELSAEAANIVRDRVPIRFKAHVYFEKIDYHTTKELEDLMNPSPISASGTMSAGSTEPPNPHHQHPSLRTLPQSSIKIYKNGVLMGTAFKDLLAFLPPASKPQAQVGAREGMDDGMLGYYPAISVFRGGAAEVNFGPNFWYPPPDLEGRDEDVDMVGTEENGSHAAESSAVAKRKLLDKVRPFSERYFEQIAEDIVYDVVDEVDFWMQDGGRVIDRTGGRDQKADTTVSIAPGSEEIKELVQDD